MSDISTRLAAKCNEMMSARLEELARACYLKVNQVQKDRDMYIRAFNELENAVTHHRRVMTEDLGNPAQWDEALYRKRDRILIQLSQGTI